LRLHNSLFLALGIPFTAWYIDVYLRCVFAVLPGQIRIKADMWMQHFRFGNLA